MTKDRGMQDFGQDAGRFDQPRAGAVEELVAVGEKDAALADRAQSSPAGVVC